MKTVYDHTTDSTRFYDEEGELLGEQPGPFFKTPYNHDTNSESARCATVTPEDEQSETDQSFKDDADINLIVKRVMQGQQVDVVLPEHFGDQTQIPTLLEAATRIADNNRAFYNLAPGIRFEFQNDPRQWERQVLIDIEQGNEENLKRMGIDMEGWTTKKEPPKTPAAPQGAAPAPGAPGEGGVAPAIPPKGP